MKANYLRIWKPLMQANLAFSSMLSFIVIPIIILYVHILGTVMDPLTHIL